MSGITEIGLRGLVPSTISAGFEEDATLLASIRWRGSKTSRHWRQTPLLDICFYEYEPALPKIDVNGTRPVCADGGEKVLGFEAVGDIVEFFAVTREEDGAGPWAVANADDIALDIFGGVVCRMEGLVEAAMAGGGVGDGRFMPACGD